MLSDFGTTIWSYFFFYSKISINFMTLMIFLPWLMSLLPHRSSRIDVISILLRHFSVRLRIREKKKLQTESEFDRTLRNCSHFEYLTESRTSTVEDWINNICSGTCMWLRFGTVTWVFYTLQRFSFIFLYFHSFITSVVECLAVGIMFDPIKGFNMNRTNKMVFFFGRRKKKWAKPPPEWVSSFLFFFSVVFNNRDCLHLKNQEREFHRNEFMCRILQSHSAHDDRFHRYKCR